MTTSEPEPSDASGAAPPSPPPAKPKAVARAVFWSFFGVRRSDQMQQDLATIKPLHLVVVGLLAGLGFVLALLALVAFVTRHA